MSWYTEEEIKNIHIALLDVIEDTEYPNISFEHLVNDVLTHPKVKGIINIDYDGVIDVIETILGEDENDH